MRNPNGIVMALAAMFSVATISGVQAAPQETPQKSFESTDVDGDGKVSWEEYRNRMVQAFHDMDRNGDGRLTVDEIPSAKDKGGQSGKSPSVTIEAFNASIEKVFKEADSDGDGALNPDEWGAAPRKAAK